MPRNPRLAKGGLIYHVHNRAAGGGRLFAGVRQYKQFEQVLAGAGERFRCRVLAYCLMPDHWHLLLWPRQDGELSEVLRWVTVTHVRRAHSQRGTIGAGSIYQGRFRSFPLQADEHFLPVARFVESHPLRSKLARRCENWRWSSLQQRVAGTDAAQPALAAWPVPRPRQWRRMVNGAQPEAELAAVRLCVQRGRPYGSDLWVARTVKRLGLESTVRPRGRPRKTATD